MAKGFQSRLQGGRGQVFHRSFLLRAERDLARSEGCRNPGFLGGERWCARGDLGGINPGQVLRQQPVVQRQRRRASDGDASAVADPFAILLQIGHFPQMCDLMVGTGRGAR